MPDRQNLESCKDGVGCRGNLMSGGHCFMDIVNSKVRPVGGECLGVCSWSTVI